MTGSVSAMTMTASERDALEQGIRMALSHASERKMTAAMLEVYQPADAHDARVESEAWAALAAVALRELERAGGRDAIAERLDALRRTIAAAHGLCIQCMERPRLEALRICGTCYRIGVPHGQDAA